MRSSHQQNPPSFGVREAGWAWPSHLTWAGLTFVGAAGDMDLCLGVEASTELWLVVFLDSLALVAHGWSDGDDVLDFCQWYGINPDGLAAFATNEFDRLAFHCACKFVARLPAA